MPAKLMIMAGGTGGHVFPGIAVANELQQQGWQIHWLGTPKRMEAEIVPKAGFEISFIDVAGVRGNGIKRLIAAPFKIIKAIQQAKQILKQQQPDLVLGMGGFASGPGGIAAWLMGIPVVIHEQNAVPGLTNKVLAKVARKVLTGFDNTFAGQGSARSKITWVGNPVRAAFSAIKPAAKPSYPINILVVGGSLGAQVLNEQLPLVLSGMKQFNVWHQTGAGNSDVVGERYAKFLADKSSWQVSDFIDDMPAAYDWADLVICRAGALTVSEVAASGVPAIFVPLPHAVDDHQSKNAQSLVDKDAAWLMPQTALEQGELARLLKDIFDFPFRLTEMGRNARAAAKLDATEKVAQICHQIVEQY